MKVAFPRPARTSWRFASVTALSVPITGERAVSRSVQLVGVVDAAEELEEVDGLGRRVLADRDAVAAADAVRRGALATINHREGEPTQVGADTLLAGAVIHLDAGGPLAHDFHGRLGVAHSRGLVVVGGALVAGLVGVQSVELDNLSAGRRAGVRVPVAGGDHRPEVLAATDAEDEVRPEVHGWPLVLARDRERNNAGGLELADVGEEVIHVAGGAEMPAFVKSALLYQTPIIPMSHGTPYCTPL